MLTAWLLIHVALGVAQTAPHSPPVNVVAEAYLGEHYVWGDIGTSGYDCSGFIQTVFRQSGVELPRSSRQQAQRGQAVALADVRPGDLLFFTAEVGGARITHVGLALSNNRMIHAARGQHQVVISRWDRPYFLNRWMAARRYPARPTAPRGPAVATAASPW